jgi:hypothetical protein
LDISPCAGTVEKEYIDRPQSFRRAEDLRNIAAGSDREV